VEGEQAEVAEVETERALGAEIAGEPDAFLVERSCARPVARLLDVEREVVERGRQLHAVIGCPPKLDVELVQLERALEIALEISDVGGAADGICPRVAHLPDPSCEGVLQPPTPLAQAAAVRPVDAQRTGETELEPALVPGARPLERPQEVRVLVLEPPHPGRGVASQSGGGPLGETRVVLGVAAVERGAVAPGGQPLQRVLADRLEHEQPRLPVEVALAHEVVLDQLRERVEHAWGRADRLGRVEREAAHEDGELVEQLLLGLLEQLVAPGDRVAKGALALVGVAAAAREEGQAFAQPFRQPSRRQHGQTRRSQLEREREPVQAAADLADHVRVAGAQAEVGLHRLRALDEQLDCGHRAQLLYGR